MIARVALTLGLLLAEPFVYERPFAAKPGTPWACHWCSRPLLPSRAFFDTDTCGRLWADQWASRGLRLHKEEIIPVR